MPSSPATSSSWGAHTGHPIDRAIIREWLSGPSGASPWIGFAFFVNAVLTGYLLPETSYSGVSGHVVDIIAGSTALATFLLAQLIRRWRGTSHLVGNAALWIIAGELAIIAPFVFVTFVSGGPNADLAVTSIAGIVADPLLVFDFALLYVGLRESRRTSRELARSRRALVAMRDALDDDIAAARHKLVARVESQLRAGFATMSDSEAPDPRLLRIVVDDVVRPLSWQLEKSATSDQDARSVRVEAMPLAETRRSFLAETRDNYRYSLALGRLVSPLLFLINMVIFALPATYLVFGPSGFLCGLITTAVTGAALRFVKDKMGSRNVSRPVAVFTGSVVTLVLSMIFPAMLSAIAGNFTAGLSIVLLAVFIATASGLLLGFIARRVDAFAEAQEINDDISALVTRLRQEDWVMRKQLARVVHGKVQGKLLAASLRLARAMNTGDESFELEQAQQDVRDAFDIVSNLGASAASSPDASIEHEITDLAEVWDGVCEISVSVTPEAHAALLLDAVAMSCITEVIRETVSNAVKHAGAARVAAAVSLVGRSRALVEVRNPGTLDASTAGGTGYGTRILDDVTVRWRIEQVGGEVSLRAEVALAHRPS